MTPAKGYKMFDGLRFSFVYNAASKAEANRSVRNLKENFVYRHVRVVKRVEGYDIYARR